MLRFFLKQYTHLYPDSGLKPKAHYFTHYSNDTRKFGPLIKTLRFESKHGYFKKSIANSKNRVNICYSMAVHHQMLMYLSYKEELYFSDDIKAINSKEVFIEELPDMYRHIVQQSEIIGSTQLMQAVKVVYQGQMY